MSASRGTSQTLSDGRSFSCSCAGSPSTPPSPTAAASRSASSSTTASRREVRLARASLRVPATISPALSPPDAHTSSSPTFSGFNGRRQSLSVPVSQLDRCKEDIPKARVRLRSTAPALLLQSPVQRAGRVIGFPDAERRAAARNGWEGHSSSSLFMTGLYVYIRHKSGPIPREGPYTAPHPHCKLRRRQPPRHRPVRRCRATGRDTDVRRTWVALRHLGPPRAPRGACLRGLAVVELSASARIWRCSCASPYGGTRTRLTSLRLRPDYHPLPNLFCQQR